MHDLPTKMKWTYYLSLDSLLEEALPRLLRSLSLPRLELEDELTLLLLPLTPSLLSLTSLFLSAVSAEGDKSRALQKYTHTLQFYVRIQ